MDGNKVSIGQMSQFFSVSGKYFLIKLSSLFYAIRLTTNGLLTEGTVELWTLRCIAAIKRNLAHLLAWPNARDRHRIRAEARSLSLFPDCVGFVNGSSIPLTYKPGSHDAVNYYNYKGF
jgi:hypothetical protein